MTIETAGRTKVLDRGAPVELPGKCELVRRLLERLLELAVLRPARDEVHDRGERGDVGLGCRDAGFDAGAQRKGVMGGARKRRILGVDERDHERARVLRAAAAAASRSGLAPDCEIAMNRTPSRSAFVAYTELIDGAADEASRPVRVSIRYFANVAAWSELPRAQVTTARGAMLRTTLSELLDEVAI